MHDEVVSYTLAQIDFTSPAGEEAELAWVDGNIPTRSARSPIRVLTGPDVE